MEKAKEKSHWLAGSKGPSLQLARLISEIAHPVFVAPLTFLVIALVCAPDLLHAALWWIVTVAGMSAALFFFIRRGVRLGHYSDHHVSIREQRLVPLLFALGCTLFVFIILLLLHASPILIAAVTAVLAAGGIATFITRYWKISFHLVGITGTVTTFWLLFGPIAALLTPLVALVAWARWRVRAHTPLQALAGMLLAVSVTIGTFWLFGLL